MPVLDTVFKSRVEAEKLLLLTPEERKAMADYDQRLEEAQSGKKKMMDRFLDTKSTTSLQKNKFGPIYRNHDSRDMLVMAMQYCPHFRGGQLFKDTWWTHSMKTVAVRI
jgi:hypothetical protein